MKTRTTLDVQRSEALSRLMRRKKVSMTSVAEKLDMSIHTLKTRFYQFESFRVEELRAIASMCGILLPTLITYIDLPSRELKKPDTGYRWMDDNDQLRERNRKLVKANDKLRRSVKGHFKQRSKYLKKDGNLHRWNEELKAKLN